MVTVPSNNQIDDEFFSAYQSQKPNNLKPANKNKKSNGNKMAKLLIPMLTLLWLILSPFTLVSLVLAFYGNPIMFKYSFIAFSWFMTICNQPCIIRHILKALSLHQPPSTSNQCVYICNRSMYAFFVFINICNTYLIIVFPNAYPAWFLIGFYNVLLSFKVGAYLSMNLRGTFHIVHFFFLCVAMIASFIIADDWTSGLLIMTPPLLWIINFNVFMVVAASLKRKHKNYAKMQSYNEQIQQKSSAFAQNLSPKRISLHINTQKRTEDELMMFSEEGIYHDTNATNSTKPPLKIAKLTGVSHKEVIYIKHSSEIKRYKQERHIHCCCSKVICSLRTCLQFQTGITAASLWASFGLFLLNKISWTVYILFIFVTCTTVWNPICYTKRCWLIRKSKKYCSADKCCMFFAYCFGILLILITVCICSILFIVANPFSVHSVDESAAISLSQQAGIESIFDLTQNENKLIMMNVVWVIAGLSFLNYLPGAGWVFYQIPVAFSLINFVGFAVCLVVPLVLVNTFFPSGTGDTSNDFASDIQQNAPTELYTFLYNEYDRDSHHDRSLIYIPHLTALISFTLYISLTGLGCSWYRFKKAIFESQANITGNKKGLQSKEFNLTLIMSFTLCLAFGDVVSDALFAFATSDNQWASPSLKYLTWTLFFLQLFIQLASFYDVIDELRNSLRVGQSLPHCAWCHKNCCPCYTILTLPYYLVIFVIGLFLGLTKLFSIKQIQEWWFQSLIRGYKKEVKRAEHKRAASSKKLRVSDNSPIVVDNETVHKNGLFPEVLSKEIVPSGSVYHEDEMAYSDFSQQNVVNNRVGLRNGAGMNMSMSQPQNMWNQHYQGQNTMISLNDMSQIVYNSMYNDYPSINAMNAPKPMMDEYSSESAVIDIFEEVMSGSEQSSSSSAMQSESEEQNDNEQLQKEEDDEKKVDDDLRLTELMKIPHLLGPHPHVESEILNDQIADEMNKIETKVTHGQLSLPTLNPKPSSDSSFSSIFTDKSDGSTINITVTKKANSNEEGIEDIKEDKPKCVRFEKRVEFDINSDAQPNVAKEFGHGKSVSLVLDPQPNVNCVISDEFASKPRSQTVIQHVNSSKNVSFQLQSQPSDILDIIPSKPRGRRSQTVIQQVNNASYAHFPFSKPRAQTVIQHVGNKNHLSLNKNHLSLNRRIKDVQCVKINKLRQKYESFERNSIQNYKSNELVDSNLDFDDDHLIELSALDNDKNDIEMKRDIEVGNGPEIQKQKDIETLQKSLRDSNPKIAKNAAEILQKLSEEAGINYFENIRNRSKSQKSSRNLKVQENILDDDGQWLGYEISSSSILWKVYLYIDSWTPPWMSSLQVKANIYNSYFISELVVESCPQLVTNLVNSYYKGSSTISNISAVFSVVMISYTMLKIIYYVGVRNKNIDKFIL